MKTLERVDAKGLAKFLRSNQLTLMSESVEGTLVIRDQTFDFSAIDEPDRQKVIQILACNYLKFERCFFIGSLWIKESTFKSITFSRCMFIKPDFNTSHDSFKSLSFSGVKAELLKIEYCIFDGELSTHHVVIGKYKFNYVTCPRLWLQGITWPGSSTLSIFRFNGRRIYLPDSTFKELCLDDLILRQVEGNKTNVKISYPGLE